MICVDFPSFRARFATRALLAPVPHNFFDFIAPNVIDSATFVWGAASPPFVPGMTLVMAGSALGNDTFTIDSVPSGSTTIYTVEQTVATEATVTMTLCEGVTYDNSGWERWPVEYMRVGDGGAPFAGGATGFSATPYDGSTVLLTVNGAAADAVYGTDEYDWYLSQRTDEPAKQYLEIVQAYDDVGPTSFSGTCRVTPTALAEAKFDFVVGAGTPIDPDVTRMLFRSCDLYVRRVTDQAIQRVDMLLKVTGN